MIGRKDSKRKRMSWKESYMKAKRFYNRHGHFPTYKENPRIHVWAMQWWRLSGKQKPEKAKLLTDIGFEPKRRVLSAENAWYSKYRLLKTFYDEHGHFPSCTENKTLHTWASNWSAAHGEKEPEKRRLLAEIGYVYQSTEEYNNRIWQANYTEAKAFYEMYGHFPRYKENYRLMQWARNWWIRSYMTHPDKNQTKAEMLREIAFNFKTSKSQKDE